MSVKGLPPKLATGSDRGQLNSQKWKKQKKLLEGSFSKWLDTLTPEQYQQQIGAFLERLQNSGLSEEEAQHYAVGLLLSSVWNSRPSPLDEYTFLDVSFRLNESDYDLAKGLSALRMHGNQSVTVSKKTLEISGEQFVPVQLAADRAQVREATMAKWMREALVFNGKPVRSMQLIGSKRLYIAEESLAELESRFVRSPGNEPVGKIKIGPTPDKTGYLSVGTAEEVLPVTRFKLHQWASKGGKDCPVSLDVVRDPISEHFLVSEQSVAALANALKSAAPIR